MKTKKKNIITGNRNIISVELIGEKIGKEDILGLEEAIEHLRQSYNHVNIIILLSKFKGSSLEANIEAIKMVGKEKDIIKKIAVVSDSMLVNIGIKIENWVTPWKEKYFSSADLDEAWEWVKSND